MVKPLGGGLSGSPGACPALSPMNDSAGPRRHAVSEPGGESPVSFRRQFQARGLLAKTR